MLSRSFKAVSLIWRGFSYAMAIAFMGGLIFTLIGASQALLGL
ncbi:MAG: hypothetical protein Q7T93_17550 [Methylobacterium sp.]|nr:MULTISPECIES: hypothetical protein [unclassified Methylobacterium]MDO9428620.1 hypothetical protein [Methylobacterium sp.]